MNREQIATVAESIGARIVSFAVCAERGEGEEVEDVAAAVLERATRFVEWTLLLGSVQMIDNDLVFVNQAGAAIAPAASVRAFRPQNEQEKEELVQLRA